MQNKDEIPAEILHQVGMWGMLPTPFSADTSGLDLPSVISLMQTLGPQGVEGFIPLGVLGEPESLSMTEKCDLLEAVLVSAEGRPVIATSMELDRDRRHNELRMFANEFGQDLAAVMIPVTSSSGDTLVADIEEAATESCLPVVVQDYPRPTGISITLTQLLAVLDRTPSLVGLKAEAQPTFARIHALKAARPDLHVIAGGGLGVVEDIAAGADAVAAQTTPAGTLRSVVALARAGDWNGAREELGTVASLIHYELQAGTSIPIRKARWFRLGAISHPGTRTSAPEVAPFIDQLSNSFPIPLE